MSKTPYLAYLKNLREAPDKRAAVQASPSKGLGGQRLAKADLAVYEDGPEEILAQLARDIKMPEETKMKIFESQRSNRALTTDEGTPITLDEANAMMEESEEKPAPPSGGLMSPAEEDTLPAVDSEDPVLGPFQNTISILKDDTEFMTQLNSMTEKYPGLTEREIFMVAAKESGVGTNMGKAKNMFQILKGPAEEAGIDYKETMKDYIDTDGLKQDAKVQRMAVKLKKRVMERAGKMDKGDILEQQVAEDIVEEQPENEKPQGLMAKE